MCWYSFAGRAPSFPPPVKMAAFFQHRKRQFYRLFENDARIYHLLLIRFLGDSISARAVSFNFMPASVSFPAQEPEEIKGVILFINFLDLFAQRRSQFQRVAI
jgi:hypothetical protein